MPPPSQSELARQAKAGVERIVKKAKLLASALAPDAPLEFAESYRKKQGLTEPHPRSVGAKRRRRGLLACHPTLAVCFSFNVIGRLGDAFGFFVPAPKAFEDGAKYLLASSYR